MLLNQPKDLTIDYIEKRDVYVIEWRNIELRAVRDRESAFQIYTQLLYEERG